ncbi:MAG: penicillin-binding protein 2 [Candidatus Kerfeldbacteria bacterium]|nr:penicillin-binding protein 2 [Candidatus Kerfeldbacteria bacterium]
MALRQRGWKIDRVTGIVAFFGIFAALLGLRLLTLQVLQHGFYTALASDQHQLFEQLLPTRGQILVKDAQSSTGYYPLATNQTLHLLYAIPKRIKDPVATATALEHLVTLPKEDLLKRLNKSNDLYEPIQHNLTDEQQTAIADLKIEGLYFVDEPTRYYPERQYGGQLLGFVGYAGDEKAGRYGLEQYYNKELAGAQGFIKAQKDASGQLIATAAQAWQPAVDGSDLLLTIDRTIQYEACRQLDEAVQKHGADSGSVVIVQPKTGAVLAMCGAPDFNPNAYNEVADAKTFLNPSTQIPYEPGSVFKALTMAAALNEGKVTPETTYTDTGEVKIGSFTIKNSDSKAHGVQTMTQVLEESLNTGAIYAMNQIGAKTFAQYVKAFGFGQATNVDVAESEGNIAGPLTHKDIYATTGSFGQGLTVTPLQLAMAYASLSNGGHLMQPYIVEQVRRPDGTTIKTEPHEIRQVISAQTSATISAMLVNVVENGHGKRAGVPGYYVAGKTGTAQIPDPKTGKYLPELTIGTFAGYAPVEDPAFVMAVQLVKPRDVQFAESSAAPLFGSLAKFLMLYFHLPPTRATTL